MRNAWNVVSAIAGVLAVAVTVFVFLQGRAAETKRLEVEVIAQATLVDESLSRPHKRIEVLFDGRKIPNYAIVVLRISNVGGQPIRSSDYESPIRLSFTNVTEVLSAEQVAADPESFQIQTSLKQGAVELSKALLNAGDRVLLEVGVVPVAGSIPVVEPRGRVAGVKRIEFKDSTSTPDNTERLVKRMRWLMFLQALLVIVMISTQLFMRRMWREF